jgi:hypothetical protein
VINSRAGSLTLDWKGLPGTNQGILPEGGKLSTVDLLIKISCLVKKKYVVLVLKTADVY